MRLDNMISSTLSFPSCLHIQGDHEDMANKNRDAVVPQRTPPSISMTLCFHYPTFVRSHSSRYPSTTGLTRPPDSSSHIFILSTLAASESASFSVSPGATAAKTRTPLPMDEMTSLSTVTDADSTRCRIARHFGQQRSFPIGPMRFANAA